MATIKAIVPNFPHDCEKCQFLGCMGDKDLYVCDEVGGRTLVVRVGHQPHEYSSIPYELMQQPHLRERVSAPTHVAFLLAEHAKEI